MAGEKILLKGLVVNPTGVSQDIQAVAIENGLITKVGDVGSYGPSMEYRIVDFGMNYICPGFIDLHVHGYGGADFMDNSYAAFDKISQGLASGGTTSFLATTMSASSEVLLSTLKNIAAYKEKGASGAQIAGVHLEGPFINPGKRGAHLESQLRLPDIKELSSYITNGKGILKMLTVAPELPGAIELIKYAAENGVTVSVGHTNASATQVYEGYKVGLSHGTHTFNAMGGLHHRDLGTVGAIMSIEGLTADIIPDGIHVHHGVIKILVRAKGIDRICIITDCMRAGGMNDGVYELGGQKVNVRYGKACLENGTIAGSTINMAQGARIMFNSVGLPLEQVIQTAATNPARILGLNSKGILEPGKDADLVVLDKEFQVLMTVVNGQIVYERKKQA